MRLSTAINLLALLPFSASFAPSTFSHQRNVNLLQPSQSSSSLFATQENNVAENNLMDIHMEGLGQTGITAPKISFRPSLPEERGKGGVQASEPIVALEVIARIPRILIITSCDSPKRAVAATAEMDPQNFSWASDLCAATLVALFPNENDYDKNNAVSVNARQAWIQSWEAGGWATDSADLGPPDIDWGPKCVNGSLLSTGSDNDKEVYAKFRFPCHPVVFRAGTGLAMLTGADEKESLNALLHRGKVFRGMRDALLTLVETPSDRKGSIRERKAWDVSDVLSRVLARATTFGEDAELSFAVVPVHERLAHCGANGENSKLVAAGDDVLLVATRDISVGEEITRDYTMAPRLDGDDTDGSLRLLLQFGLPPLVAAGALDDH